MARTNLLGLIVLTHFHADSLAKSTSVLAACEKNLEEEKKKREEEKNNLKKQIEELQQKLKGSSNVGVAIIVSD